MSSAPAPNRPTADFFGVDSPTVQVLGALSAYFGTEFECVPKLDHLPKSARKWAIRQGFSDGLQSLYDTISNKVYLIGDQISDAHEAAISYLHEVVGHKGIRTIASESELLAVYQAYRDSPHCWNLIDRYGIDPSTRTSQLYLAEELVAHLAQRGMRATVKDRLESAVKAQLHRITGSELRYTDADVHALIARAGSAIRRNLGGDRPDPSLPPTKRYAAIAQAIKHYANHQDVMMGFTDWTLKQTSVDVDQLGIDSGYFADTFARYLDEVLGVSIDESGAGFPTASDTNDLPKDGWLSEPDTKNRYRAMYVGTDAELADGPTSDLNTAIRMKAEGSDEETIRHVTGWSTTLCGEWMYELNDSLATERERLPALRERVVSQIGAISKELSASMPAPETLASLQEWQGVLDGIDAQLSSENEGSLYYELYHPTLFDAHPSLKEFTVKRVDDLAVDAYLDPSTRTFFISCGLSGPDYVDALIHETQHAVQLLENWSMGTEVGVGSELVERANSLRRAQQHPDFLAAKQDYVDTLSRLGLDTDDAQPRTANTAIEVKRARRHYLVQPAVKEVTKAHKQLTAAKKALRAYRATSGEIMAHDTVIRRCLADSARRRIEPFHSQQKYIDTPPQVVDRADIATKSAVSAMFVGRHAVNAPLEDLTTAVAMSEQGVDDQEIWQQTGWVNMFGKWVCELSDDELQISPYYFDLAKAAIATNGVAIPSVTRVEEDGLGAYRLTLSTNYLQGAEIREIPAEDISLYLPDAHIEAALDALDIGEPGYSFDGGEPLFLDTTVQLSNLIEHPALFNAYPQLSEWHVKFVQPGEYGEGFEGECDPNTKTLTVVMQEESAVAEILVHEIQHAVQVMEGLAVGGTPKQLREDQLRDRIHRKVGSTQVVDLLGDPMSMSPVSTGGAGKEYRSADASADAVFIGLRNPYVCGEDDFAELGTPAEQQFYLDAGFDGLLCRISGPSGEEIRCIPFDEQAIVPVGRITKRVAAPQTKTSDTFLRAVSKLQGAVTPSNLGEIVDRNKISLRDMHESGAAAMVAGAQADIADLEMAEALSAIADCAMRAVPLASQDQAATRGTQRVAFVRTNDVDGSGALDALPIGYADFAIETDDRGRRALKVSTLFAEPAVDPLPDSVVVSQGGGEALFLTLDQDHQYKAVGSRGPLNEVIASHPSANILAYPPDRAPTGGHYPSPWPEAFASALLLHAVDAGIDVIDVSALPAGVRHRAARVLLAKSFDDLTLDINGDTPEFANIDIDPEMRSLLGSQSEMGSYADLDTYRSNANLEFFERYASFLPAEAKGADFLEALPYSRLDPVKVSNADSLEHIKHLILETAWDKGSEFQISREVLNAAGTVPGYRELLQYLPETGSAAEYLNAIDSLTTSGAIVQNELHWDGLEGWLEEEVETVIDRTDLINHIRYHGRPLRETWVLTDSKTANGAEVVLSEVGREWDEEKRQRTLKIGNNVTDDVFDILVTERHWYVPGIAQDFYSEDGAMRAIETAIQMRIDGLAKSGTRALYIHDNSEIDKDFLIARCIFRESQLGDGRRILHVLDMHSDTNAFHPLGNHWSGIVAERLLQHAVEEGYDGVSWPTPEHLVNRPAEERAVSDLLISRVGTEDGPARFQVQEVRDYGLRNLFKAPLSEEELRARLKGPKLEKLLKQSGLTEENRDAFFQDIVAYVSADRDLHAIPHYFQRQLTKLGGEVVREKGRYYLDIEPALRQAVLKVDQRLPVAACMKERNRGDLTERLSTMLPRQASSREYAHRLSALQRKGHCKAVDLDNTGVLEWLDSSERHRSREEVLAFISQNAPSFKEHIHYSQVAPAERPLVLVDEVSVEDGLQRLVFEDAAGTGYSAVTWRQEGKYYYPELDESCAYLTLADVKRQIGSEFAQIEDERRFGAKGQGRYGSYTKGDQYSKYYELILTRESTSEPSAHWNGYSGVVGHARMTERHSEQGERTLFVDEIQRGEASDGLEKHWAMMVMKRVTRFAAEQGYDSVVLAGAQDVAELFPKDGKPVDISVFAVGDKYCATDVQGKPLVTRPVEISELLDRFDLPVDAPSAQEIAEKVRKKGAAFVPNLTLNSANDVDKVYGQVVPWQLSTFLKPYGIALKPVTIDLSQAGAANESTATRLGFRISPALRASLANEQTPMLHLRNPRQGLVNTTPSRPLPSGASKEDVAAALDYFRSSAAAAVEKLKTASPSTMELILRVADDTRPQAAIIDELLSITGGHHDADNDPYFYLAGEAMARLTQRRQALSSFDRQQQFPLDHLDIKQEEAIVQYSSSRPMAMFAGECSLTVDHAMLEKAKQLRSTLPLTKQEKSDWRTLASSFESDLNDEQRSRLQHLRIRLDEADRLSEIIWEQTGFYLEDRAEGEPERWVYELDSSRARLIGEVSDLRAKEFEALVATAPDCTREFHARTLQGRVIAARTYHLPDVIDWPEVYEAYPQLKSLRVIENPNLPATAALDGGAWEVQYNPSKNDEGTLLSALIHETTHAVQLLEDFPAGANHRRFDDPNEEQLATYASAQAALDAMRLALNERVPRSKRVAFATEQTTDPVARQWIQALHYTDIVKLEHNLRLTVQPKQIKYWHTLGEKRAREVESRLEMGAQERMSYPPERVINPAMTSDEMPHYIIHEGIPPAVVERIESVISQLDSATDIAKLESLKSSVGAIARVREHQYEREYTKLTENEGTPLEVGGMR